MLDVAGLRIDLDRAIRRSPLRRRAILREYLAGRDYEEIAAFFKISVGNVGRQLHLARKAVRTYLNGEAER